MRATAVQQGAWDDGQHTVQRLKSDGTNVSAVVEFLQEEYSRLLVLGTSVGYPSRRLLFRLIALH